VSGDPYTIPGSSVLRNKLGITAPARLDLEERRWATKRACEGIPTGNFDLPRLCAIHHHLFQDIYTWAGELRTVEIAKGGHQFQFRRFIGTGMADIHRRLIEANFLRGLTRTAFAKAAGAIMGDVNYVHPFREGNGRTQLYYLEQLAEQARHPLDLRRLDPKRWIEASRAARAGDYAPMISAIARAITIKPTSSSSR
jgi:cell filamentation protein